MSDTIFGPPSSRPRAVWNASDFVDVDDRVRGGSSRSAMRLVADQAEGDKHPSSAAADKGTIDFTGFLDTTTLGGAGFASQAYPHPLPGTPLDSSKYSGLRIVVKPIQSEISSNSSPISSYSGDNQLPGGGKGPVYSYVLNLKTQEAKERPDGRRESQVVYEFKFDLPRSSFGQDECTHLEYASNWSEFAPTYRGRPAKDAPALDPAQIKEWSIMARSDFGMQSGPFTLRLITLAAVPLHPASPSEKRTLFLESPTSAAYASMIQSPDPNHGSSEYYGFALYIFATVIFFVWILWALTPDRILKGLGIDWYPNREWAFLLPAWSLFAVLFIYAAFMALNMHNNPRLDDLSQVVDSHANVLPLGHAAEASNGTASKHPLYGCNMAQTGNIDGPMAMDIYDLPPGLVSRERHGM